SMKKQNWEGGGDKRDDDLRKELELMERKHLTADQIERQLTEFSAQYEADPNNIKVVKRIASLYEMKKDLAQAITFFEWAYTLSQGDVALAAHVRELKDKYREEEFTQMSAEIEANPEAP